MSPSPTIPIMLNSAKGIRGAHTKAVYGHNNMGLWKVFMEQKSNGQSVTQL